MNYYEFDKIVTDELGCKWGYIGKEAVEVFECTSDDTEKDLVESGFAKCDAPGTETFLVEESAIKCIKK